MIKPIAILVSDLHLSIKQPACRADDDWMRVQAGYLQELKDLAKAHPSSESLPVICAGDIFDKWNPPPELIHFALEHLPEGMICIPGQHDLPNHVYEEMHRSGYGVLEKAKKIDDISECVWAKEFCAVGFPWGVKPSAWTEGIVKFSGIKIAVIHRYCWTEGFSYPEAPKDGHVDSMWDLLKGYDIAHFGDNHKSFTVTRKGLTVVNTGGFIRRKSDEIDYKPNVFVVYSDGKVKRHRLDTSRDKFHDPKTVREEMPFDMKALIDELKGLGEHGLNFKDEVLRHLDREKVDAETRKAVLEALEE